MILKRIIHNDNGTFGVLIHNYQPFALTYELPWHDNKKNISCIPAGKYTCVRKDSPSRGQVFEIKDVEGRNHILFHKGNTQEDSQGCILIGEEFGYLSGIPAILSSKRGFGEFMRLLDGEDKFILRILSP